VTLLLAFAILQGRADASAQLGFWPRFWEWREEDIQAKAGTRP
jgi:hypothetical protein